MIDWKYRALMRRAAVAVVAFGFAALLGAQTAATPSAKTPAVQAHEWKTYSYPADGFSAVFPSDPEMQKKDVPTGNGSFELRTYLASDNAAGLVIGVLDASAAVAGKDPEELLQGAKNGALRNTNTHLLSEKKIALGIYPGVEFEAENDSMHLSVRLYLVGSTLYQTLTASPLGKPYAGTVRFLDSFQLIARVKN